MDPKRLPAAALVASLLLAATLLVVPVLPQLETHFPLAAGTSPSVERNLERAEQSYRLSDRITTSPALQVVLRDKVGLRTIVERQLVTWTPFRYERQDEDAFYVNVAALLDAPVARDVLREYLLADQSSYPPDLADALRVVFGNAFAPQLLAIMNAPALVSVLDSPLGQKLSPQADKRIADALLPRPLALTAFLETVAGRPGSTMLGMQLWSDPRFSTAEQIAAVRYLLLPVPADGRAPPREVDLGALLLQETVKPQVKQSILLQLATARVAGSVGPLDASVDRYGVYRSDGPWSPRVEAAAIRRAPHGLLARAETRLRAIERMAAEPACPVEGPSRAERRQIARQTTALGAFLLRYTDVPFSDAAAYLLGRDEMALGHWGRAVDWLYEATLLPDGSTARLAAGWLIRVLDVDTGARKLQRLARRPLAPALRPLVRYSLALWRLRDGKDAAAAAELARVAGEYAPGSILDYAGAGGGTFPVVGRIADQAHRARNLAALEQAVHGAHGAARAAAQLALGRYILDRPHLMASALWAYDRQGFFAATHLRRCLSGHLGRRLVDYARATSSPWLALGHFAAAAGVRGDRRAGLEGELTSLVALERPGSMGTLILRPSTLGARIARTASALRQLVPDAPLPAGRAPPPTLPFAIHDRAPVTGAGPTGQVDGWTFAEVAPGQRVVRVLDAGRQGAVAVTAPGGGGRRTWLLLPYRVRVRWEHPQGAGSR